MIQDVLTHLKDTLWPLAALVFFILLFSGVVVWTFRGGQDRFREVTRLPLDEQSDEAHNFSPGESRRDVMRADA